MSNETIKLCVIGLGPRGLSVFERLCANAHECLSEGVELVVHLVDPHLLGGGQVWRTDQDPELLMNTVTSQASVFLDDSVQCDGPVVRGPSLYEWARFISILSIIASPQGIPDHVRAEAARLGPDSYPSRAFYGHYLSWTMQHLIRVAPANIRVELHVAGAIDLRDGADGSQIVTLADGETITGLGAVVLTLGHLPNRQTTTEAAFTRFAVHHRLRYVPPGNPADVRLDAIGPGEPTVLRGMGLNFFDHMALLTVGRGGSFHRGDGGLVYRPSGREPKLYAGSRRGVPYQARGENQKGAAGRHIPRLLTDAVIADFRARADRGEPADFRTDLWPLIDAEVRTVYYATLVRERLGPVAADEFADRFLTVAGRPGADDPFAADPPDAESALLTGYGIGEGERWDWHTIARPYTGTRFTGTAEFRAWLRSYLDTDVRAALLGNVRGALKAALDVLRDLRNEIRLVVDHGGLCGDSYRDDLQGWYMPLNAYLSIGPPVRRVEEMIALIDAGVLDVLGPDLRVDRAPDGRGFVAWSGLLPDVTVQATALIEARLPEPDLRHTTDPLVRTMVARGECVLYRMPVRGGGHYATGGLAVTTRPYRLLDADGNPHPRRFAFGVPTETVHWVTAAGIRPGVNSVILGDADAVARAGIFAAVPQSTLARR
ncbi:FAD/NAD(P)-binding protein [Actinokineospora sp.]|uniref:FAD/NAD(P)-binding protein n=1 Tax=Actinokineospora sp. TaxID=1872133 RepID=UPI0040381FB9